MKLFNFKKNEKVIGLMAQRGTKAYPFGRGIPVLIPEDKAREYLNNNFDYSEDELQLYDFDKNCFLNYCKLKYDNDISTHRAVLLDEIKYFIGNNKSAALFYKIIVAFENIKTFRDMAAFLLFVFDIHPDPKFKEEDEQNYENFLDDKQKLHVLIKMFGW